MPTVIPAAAGQFSARPIKNALIPPEGPKTVNFSVPFGSVVGETTYIADLTFLYTGGFVSTIQSIFVDNSANTFGVTVFVPSTGQRLIWPAGMQGYLPILAPTEPKFEFTSTTTTPIQVQFLNVPVPAQLWSSTGSSTVPNPLTVQLATNSTIFGRVGGITDLFSAVPAVTAVAYSTGQNMGGLITITNAARFSGGSGLIQSIALMAATVQTAALDVVFFNANPSGSTVTNAVALAIAAADLAKVIGVANLSGPIGLGGPVVYNAQNLTIPFELPSGTSLFAAIVARAAITLGSTTDLTFNTHIIQD